MSDSSSNVESRREDSLVSLTTDKEAVIPINTKYLLSLLKKSIAEGIAYYFVILSIYLSSGDQTKFIYAFWCIFMVFGNVSGAHVNPIVSVGLYIYRGNMFRIKNIIRLISYISFQFIFGILAALSGYYVYNKNLAYIKPSTEATTYDIFICECFFSGTLLFVCLFITCKATTPSKKNHVNLTLISAWLYVIINAGLDISGGCYNPTIYLVLNGLAYFTGHADDAFEYLWFYIFAPIVGSIIFTLLFKYVFKPYYMNLNSSRNHKTFTYEYNKLIDS